MRGTLREYVTGSDKPEPILSGQSWGYVFGAVGACLFAMKAIFVKLAYQPMDGLAVNQIDAITLMALRLGFSLPVYIGVMWWSLRKLQKSGLPRPRFKHMAMAGLLGVLGYYICAFLDIHGLKYVTAQLERLLLFTYPVFVLILSAIFLGFRPKPLSIASILLGYLGIVVIFSGGDIATGENLVLGTVMILMCAMLFAGFQLMAKPMITILGSTIFTCCAMIAAGAVIFVHLISDNLISGSFKELGAMPPRIWMIGVALAFLSTLIPSFMVNIAIGRIGAQATAMLGLLSPIATILSAIIWLGEPFGFYDGIGTVMTLIGIGFYSWYSRKNQGTDQIKPAAFDK